MRSLYRRRKKSKRLERVERMSREEFETMALDSRVELIRNLIPIGLMHIFEELDKEVTTLCGERYERKNEDVVRRRHGSNPGSVRLGGQKVGIQVPRVRGERSEIPLRSYGELQEETAANNLLLRRVLYGISCRNYEKAAESIPGALGLSSSSVSRSFVKSSTTKLKEFQERDLSTEQYVALFIDGKTFAEDTMVIALGVTEGGEKRPLGFVQTETENQTAMSDFLRELLGRGLEISEGILVVIDGSKGLRSAVRKVFNKRAVVQRCMWHKRENVLGYLPKQQQVWWRRRLQRAYDRPTYSEASTELKRIQRELEQVNQSAARSLAEGLEETLTLHRLGVYSVLGQSFKTTNCIESINALVEERCAKVDSWRNSSQKHRWLAVTLLDVEGRLRRVKGYRHLSKLREALRRELRIGVGSSQSEKVA
jgi:putative transposase